MSQAGSTLGGGGSSTALTITTDSGNAVESGGIIQILGGTNVTTSGAGNIVLINATSSGLTWQVVTSADNPVTLTANNGYIAKGAGAVNFVLPAAASIGDTYRIIGYGNLWDIAQNAGQSVTIGFTTTTVGVGGSVTATMISDGLELVCVTANLEFFETYVQGNPTII